MNISSCTYNIKNKRIRRVRECDFHKCKEIPSCLGVCWGAANSHWFPREINSEMRESCSQLLKRNSRLLQTLEPVPAYIEPQRSCTFWNNDKTLRRPQQPSTFHYWESHPTPSILCRKGHQTHTKISLILSGFGPKIELVDQKLKYPLDRSASDIKRQFFHTHKVTSQQS